MLAAGCLVGDLHAMQCVAYLLLPFRGFLLQGSAGAEGTVERAGECTFSGIHLMHDPST